MQGQTTTTRPKHRWRRLIIALAGALFVAALLAVFEAHRSGVRRDSLATEIQRAGGYAEQPKTVLESVQFWRKAGELPPRRTYAHLLGPAFNNQWIRERNYLRDFSFRILECDSITGDDLARLIEAHPLESLYAPGLVLTDEVLRAIRENPTLTMIALGDSDYTDEQLAGLPLEQLEVLMPKGVTPEGLLQVRRCRALESISLEGPQLTQEVADMLAALGTVDSVHLFGPEVTDEHLEHLQRIASLREVSAFGTNATDDGRVALTAALPNCKVALKPAPPE
jgi:hypothetical protein